MIVEQASALLLNYRLLSRQGRGHARVAYWGHGRNFADDLSTAGELVKRWTSRRVHWWFAYTERTAAVVRDLAVPTDRITVVNNAIDTTALEAAVAEARTGAAHRDREELGLGPGPVAIFVGHLRPEKGLEVLFDAAAKVHARRPGFQLLVVGSGPLQGEVAQRAAATPWLHYLGLRFGSDLARALALADLMVLPNSVGLAILDSFVAHAPLITSRDGNHGPEIAYLRDGENGLFVDRADDVEGFARAILTVIDDPALAERLVEGCRAAAERYSVEDMVDRFADGIRRALRTPRTPAAARSRGRRG